MDAEKDSLLSASKLKIDPKLSKTFINLKMY